MNFIFDYFVHISLLNIYRECFLSWYHIESSRALIRHAGVGFPQNTLISRLSNSQLQTYMQMIWEEYVDLQT